MTYIRHMLRVRWLLALLVSLVCGAVQAQEKPTAATGLEAAEAESVLIIALPEAEIDLLDEDRGEFPKPHCDFLLPAFRLKPVSFRELLFHVPRIADAPIPNGIDHALGEGDAPKRELLLHSTCELTSI